MRISDWSSDVCSSDLRIGRLVFAHRTCLRRDLREIGRGESVALAQYSSAEKGVLKLADIARPGMRHQEVQCLGRNSQAAQAGLGRDSGEKMAASCRDVAVGLAKGGWQGGVGGRRVAEGGSMGGCV